MSTSRRGRRGRRGFSFALAGFPRLLPVSATWGVASSRKRLVRDHVEWQGRRSLAGETQRIVGGRCKGPMRLRAVLQGSRRLQEVLRALERASKAVTVLMSPEEIMIVANPSMVDNLQVWAALAAVSRASDCPNLPPSRAGFPACSHSPPVLSVR